LSGAELRVLAEEQAALRRVATLVARGVPPQEVFAAVTEEAGRLSVEHASLGRYESDGTMTTVATSSQVGERFPVGLRWRLAGRNVHTIVFETRGPARMDNYADASGPLGVVAREAGVGSGVGAPIIVEGRLWGVIATYARLGQPQPADTEARLASFTELVATAIANAESRAELARLAQEQAALRRVATLVARVTPPEEVFAAVTEEVARLLGAELSGMARFESDATMTVLGSWAAEGEYVGAQPLVPGSWPLEGGDVASTIARTGRPVRIDDYHGVPGRIAAFVRGELGASASVGSPIVVEGTLWGALFVHSKQTRQPFPQDTESRLAGFTELVATAVANAESRAGLARLADEQAALRRVATLVAGGAPPQELFATVVEEVGRLLGTHLAGMARYDSDDTVNVLASWAAEGEHPLVPGPWPLDAGDLASIIWRTGRPVRTDDYHGVPGRVAAFVRERLGIGSSVGSPIVVEGRVWGALIVHSKQPGRPFPRDTESRLTGFTELVATAIANAESGAKVARLAQEQAALRRVATLVARGTPPEQVFAAVVAEAGRLLSVEYAALGRYEPDGTSSIVAVWGRTGHLMPVGLRVDSGGKNVSSLVFETGRPVRIDGYPAPSWPLDDVGRDEGFGSGVGTPVIVEGRLWGVMATHSALGQPLPEDTEARLRNFTELVATAIANAESRGELMASRTRIVAAADETRRRIERDLHDGTQQRLVSLGLELRAAQATVPPHLGEVDGALSRVADGLGSVFDELREISHGIHPAILSKGGLQPALNALRRRSVVPVELAVHAERRLPEPVEVAAYYVVSEALANAAKHAQASVVNVELDTDDAIFTLAIRDDGIGGADLSAGSGLVGLSDRIAALGGTLQVTSPAGHGTTLLIEIPLEDQSSSVSPQPINLTPVRFGDERTSND
jgi:GAF domain-containing protein